MLEKVKGIRIKGRCFKSDTNLICFPNDKDRISIIYGKNGSGKSTISEGFSCIANNDILADLTASLIDAQNVSLTLANDSSIFVFNEKYIDENVKIDDDGLGTIILLGGQVDLQSKIDEQALEVATLENEKSSLEKTYETYSNLQNPLNPLYHWARIGAILKQAGGWAEVDSRIKHNRRNSSVNDDVIKEICGLSTKLTSTELQEKFNDVQTLLNKVSDTSTTYPEEIKPINYDNDWEDIILNILSEKIEEPNLSEREKLILNSIQNGGQTILEDVRNRFSDENTTFCPYCYQIVSQTYKNELIENINKVLNRDVEAHKEALGKILFPNVALDLSIYESLDPDLTKSIYKEVQKCQKIIEDYNNAVKQKQNNLYTPVVLQSKGLCELIRKLNELLIQLDSKRREFNDAASKKNSLMKELIYINKLIAHLQTAQIYKDYIKQETEKNDFEKKLIQNQEKLKSSREILRDLEQRKSNIGLAITNINNALDYVFFSRERLSIELKNDKYYLKSNGNDVKPKNVSLGERNIIALCYFFTQILANQDISKLYEKETLVVVDDPVSSFDFENKVGIISFLRHQISKLINGNQKSKVLILSHDLETVFSLRKAADEICQSTKGIAGLTPSTFIALKMDNSKLCQLTKNHNEYSELIKKIYRYAIGDDSVDSIIIGNTMRRVLEAFSTFSYQKPIEKVSCDKNILKALDNRSLFFENLMYRLVLHGESHYEEQVYSIHDGNNFYGLISEAEKQKTAKNILCFMYLLNPSHVIAYLQSETNSIKNIEQWVKDIPENHTFEVSQLPTTRIIHLYDIPLSAGIGNEIFEETQYEEYETENLICDFALRISGDSMEPKIKEGSVVLIKRTNVVAEGKVGAFYHNGKVYCKYLSYEDGNTLLCSYNEEYPPIKIEDEDSIVTYGEVIDII